MLVEHPTIYVDATGAVTDALLVRNGRVIATGDAARSQAGEDTVIRPDGACVFPALTDAHIHMWGLGLRQGSVSLGAAKTTDEVYRILANYDREAAPGGWALGRDWDQHRWEDADALDIGTLDEMFGDQPLVLRRVDGHALWVNTAALRAAGITDDWNPGPNGRVARDAHGKPTGLLVDDATDPVLDAIPPPDVAEDRAVFLQTCEMLIRHGVTTAHVAWMPLDRIQMLENLRDSGELPLRLNLLLDGRDADLARELERGPRFDDWLTVNGVKFFADGAMGSQGAHLLDGYPDGSTGLILEPHADLVQRVPELAARGWQVAIHAIGDAAARSVLDAYAAVAPEHRSATRPRLEHAQMLSDDDVARFGELGVIASIQPVHLRNDGVWAREMFEHEQRRRLFRWRDLERARASLPFGSDYPIEDPNPWHGVATAVSQRDRTGEVLDPDQTLDRPRALAGYTTAAAWAGHREQSAGRLAPGCYADFAVLEADPVACSEADLWDMRVAETFVAAGEPDKRNLVDLASR